MTTCRSGLHELRGPADRRPDGRCIRCHRATQARYRHSLQQSRRLLRQIGSQIACEGFGAHS